MENLDRLNVTLPLLALRGLAVFPKMILNFDVGRKKSTIALTEAMEKNQLIFLTAQKDLSKDDPQKEDLYQIGTVVQIKQIFKMPGDNIRILVEGVYRAKIKEIVQIEPSFVAVVDELIEKPITRNVLVGEALIRTTQALFEVYMELVPKLPPEIIMTVMTADNEGYLADYIASNTMLKVQDKQFILEELSHLKRLEKLIVILEKENDVLSLEHDIHNRVREQIDKNQREYYIREQIKILSSEIGDGENIQEEVYAYRDKIEKLSLPNEVSEKLLKEAERLSKMPYGSHESSVIRSYLDNCLDLPWNKQTKDKIDLEQAEKQLEKDHYGLEKVKERIIEFLAVKKLAPDLKGQILCFVGPPGVGKTSIAKSIAAAMGRKYARVSLGGVRDEADIRGHRKTYIGSMPGRIITAIKQAGSNNPLILLDEVDKLGNDLRGDPSSALLEVLDSEQNFAFRDHYIEVPFDLSNVIFITTANTLDTIPRPLLDRMEIIEISSYTYAEKYNIALKHLIPKQMKRHNLNKRNFHILDDAVKALIEGYTREAGVRSLERQIANLCRKAAKLIATGSSKKVQFEASVLENIIGPKKFKPELISQKDEIGVVTGLAWTSVGGEILTIEVSVMDGTGKIELTGSLGDVMKESARAAISYIRSRAAEFGIDKNFYKEKDIHIHVPEGAIPKDGPSAGITIATALMSELTKSFVRRDVAMTGEITLRGRILPIGGLKEKTMAAYRAGIKTVIIPSDNEADLSEIDKTVKNELKFVIANDMDTVFKTALIFNQKNGVDQSNENNIPLIIADNNRNIPTIPQ